MNGAGARSGPCTTLCHQTLFRYLDKQPLADTLAELQAQIDAFDHIYNTERPHQGLPERVTPTTAWKATEKAEALCPKPEEPFFVRDGHRKRFRPAPAPTDLPAGSSTAAGPSAAARLRST